MSGTFSVLIQNPKVLDFDNKRSYFQRQLHKRKDSHVHREHYGTLQINVRRQFVFEDSWHSLMRRTGDEIKNGKMSIRFYDEEGVDAGGVAREWFQVLARQMFNPNYALWSEYQLVQEDFACFELTYMFLLPSFFVNSPSSLVPHSVITDYLAPCGAWQTYALPHSHLTHALCSFGSSHVYSQSLVLDQPRAPVPLQIHWPHHWKSNL